MAVTGNVPGHDGAVETVAGVVAHLKCNIPAAYALVGPGGVSPTFTYAAAACGNSVSASVSYSMNVEHKTFVIPISATA